jgi:type VI secretion system secreted protein VgrG
MAKNYVEVRLESPHFKCDNIRVHRLTGKEAISQIFTFDIEAYCLELGDVATESMPGADLTLVFEQKAEANEMPVEIRRVHGMIAEVVDLLETEVKYRGFRIHFVPRAYRSTLIETQEVFLNLSVPDIIKQKLELVGLAGEDVEMRLQGTYPVREFVVQYRETDLAFISRLAEHLGISFFFEHDDARDKIVFTDHKAGFAPIKRSAPVPFQPRGETVDVYRLHERRRVIPKSYVVQDWNYRTPLVDITQTAEAPSGLAGGVVEQGPHHKTPEEGEALAKVRAEEREATHLVYEGEGEIAEFSPGATFALDGHPLLDDPNLLIVDCEHRLSQVVAIHGGTDAESEYLNRFHVIPSRLTYRPPRVTPKPKIYGVTTGIVEEPDPITGRHSFIDDQGRYWVKLLFDTADKSGRKASRPIRMIQSHAGPSYGFHFPLKPGIEVLLIFVDGDPDRPLIAGSVPNPITPSPVVETNSVMNRIKTVSGVVLEIKDAFISESS